MFLPVKNSRRPNGAPVASQIDPADWAVLAACWHPVAFAAEIGMEPLAVRLLDLPLVLWRGDDGITVAQDRCPHRGARVSMGALRDGNLVCPLHGFRYGPDGACRKVPALASTASISKRLCLTTYRSSVRYGLVWVCLGDEARLPLPELPEIEREGATVAEVPPGTWAAAAPRHVENFNDLCHIPFVHGQTFGGDEDVTVEPYDVVVTDETLSFAVDYFEQPRASEGMAIDPAQRRHRRYRYRLSLPFATALTVEDVVSGSVFHIFDVASPVSAFESRIFQVLVDPTGSRPPADMIDFQLRINAEDAPLIETQRPQSLPLDVTEDVHIPADRLSIEYRRALARLGLGRGTA